MDKNETDKHCQHCGKLLGSKAIQGLCPACLLKAGWPTATESEDAAGQRFTPPQVEQLASLFPQLEILGLIGRGGMGAVYKARQPELDRFVALKVLAPRDKADPGFAERFSREARALARLNHPNIVAVYDFGHRDNLHYFIMEYVDGPNLRQIQKAKQLQPQEALEIIPHICEALQFAHDAGVVHRDIKPENVLLDQEGRIKIADFGLAKIMGKECQNVTLTREGHVMGTPHYMAPEQVEHPQDVDHRADIFSLGVVLYEMLTGELPLGEFVPPSGKVRVDVRLDEVVLRTLAKEPERRYQHASEVKTDIQSLGHGAGEPGVSQFSRAALWGGIWALVMVVSYVWNYTPPGWAITRALRNSVMAPFGELLSVLMLVVGFATPVGMTVLGWIAIRDVRCSFGRIRGLGWAVLEAIFFPLLAVNFWLLKVCSMLADKSIGHSISGVFTGSVLSILVDILFVRWLWLRMKRPLEPEVARVLARLRPTEHTKKPLVYRVWQTTVRAASIVVVELLLSETIWLMSRHWRESSEELCSMALMSAALGGMIWAAWPLRSPKRYLSFLLPIGVGLVLFVAQCAWGYYYGWYIRPNIGLRQEADWVAQHPGFQRKMRKMIAKNFWGRDKWPSTFEPIFNITLPPVDSQDTIMVDLDTSQTVIWPELDTHGERISREGWDLAVTLDSGKLILQALGTHVVYESEELWDTVIPQDIVGFWKQESKPPPESTSLRLFTDYPNLYYFYTHTGGMGLLRVTGNINDLNEVSIQCRRVRDNR